MFVVSFCGAADKSDPVRPEDLVNEMPLGLQAWPEELYLDDKKWAYFTRDDLTKMGDLMPPLKGSS